MQMHLELSEAASAGPNRLFARSIGAL